MTKFILGLMLAATTITSPTPTQTAGVGIACNSGNSPCTVSNTAADVLKANTARKSCFLQAVGAATLYCKKATAAASAATSSSFDFLLYGSTALQPGNGYQCDSNGSVWQGAINCLASASQTNPDIAVVENQ